MVVGTTDGGNAWTINGNKVNRPRKENNPNGLWQDNEKEFIDFAKVEQEAKDLVENLSNLENNGTIIKNTDQNNQEIIIDNQQFSVYNIKNGDFNFTNPIHIKGFDTINYRP